MKILGKLCTTGELSVVEVADGRIAGISAATESTVADLGGADVWISPGFIDTQFNGYGGYDFNRSSWTQGDASDAAAGHIAELAAKAGTPMLCPTIVTNSTEGIIESLEGLARVVASDKSLSRAFPGFHVEGPYMSSEEGSRGAHPVEHIRDPDWDEFQRFQEAANGRVKILTLAPERDGALPFIEKAVASGVVISIGHTDATPEQIHDAVKAGARMSTHLGNGSKALLPRHQNFLWAQLAADEVSCAIICDGHHLPGELVKCFARVKGTNRLVLVSDAVALGGRPPGLYDDNRHEVLPSGKVVLAGTPYLAGAGHLLDVCVANALRFSELGMAGIAQATATNPARLLDLPETGEIKAGYHADLSLFREPNMHDDKPLDIVATLRGGDVVYRA